MEEHSERGSSRLFKLQRIHLSVGLRKRFLDSMSTRDKGWVDNRALVLY